MDRTVEDRKEIELIGQVERRGEPRTNRMPCVEHLNGVIDFEYVAAIGICGSVERSRLIEESSAEELGELM
jgi:hypothetical protein